MLKWNSQGNGIWANHSKNCCLLCREDTHPQLGQAGCGDQDITQLRINSTLQRTRKSQSVAIRIMSQKTEDA
eukprot:487630-Pelagomonas_calceolata.AAC.4